MRTLILAWKNHITHKKFLAFHVCLFSHSGEPASDSTRFHASSRQNVPFSLPRLQSDLFLTYSVLSFHCIFQQNLEIFNFWPNKLKLLKYRARKLWRNYWLNNLITCYKRLINLSLGCLERREGERALYCSLTLSPPPPLPMHLSTTPPPLPPPPPPWSRVYS